jgi:hypothetical protein
MAICKMGSKFIFLSNRLTFRAAKNGPFYKKFYLFHQKFQRRETVKAFPMSLTISRPWKISAQINNLATKKKRILLPEFEAAIFYY